MEVKSAVAIAKKWLAEVLRDERPTNIGLEEVEFDDRKQLWLITLGFSRPWNTAKNPFTAISGEPVAKRAYRIIAVKEPEGKVISMKQRGTDD